MSNLCAEITLPTKPLVKTDDPNGEIALCTLSAFNLGAINSLDDLQEVAFFAVAALDSLLDYKTTQWKPQSVEQKRAAAWHVCNQLCVLPGEEWL
jgi:ribonucleotide reductase alpha subunit